MIFSGSAVVDRTDSSGLCGGRPCLVAIYTGHTEKKQTQNLAFSIDRGRTWAKYRGNPVVDLGLKDFRDPKVFWHEDTKRWVMVTVLPDQHKVRFFSSPDLKRWDALSDFGPAGATGGVWECPDLFPLAIEGTTGETRWVLDVDLNPGGIAGGSGGQYFVGRFDGRTFVNDAPASETLWSDYGKDFYATISFSDIPPTDGRRIWMAWMSNWPTRTRSPRAAGAAPCPCRVSSLCAGHRRGCAWCSVPCGSSTTLRTGAEPVRVAASTALPAAAEFTLRSRCVDRRGDGAGLSPAWSQDCSPGRTSAVKRQWGRGADWCWRFTARGLRRSPPLACCTARALSRPARGARSRGRWRRPPPRHRRSLDGRSVRQRRRDGRIRSAVAHATVHSRGAGARGGGADAAGDVAAAKGVEGWGSVESLIVEPELSPATGDPIRQTCITCSSCVYIRRAHEKGRRSGAEEPAERVPPACPGRGDGPRHRQG